MRRWGRMALRVVMAVLLLAIALYGALAALSGMLYDDQGAPVRLKVASVTLQVDRDPAVNRGKMASWTRTITREQPGTELVLFGEASTGHYARSLRELAEPLDGETVTTLSRVARETGVHVCFGMPERSGKDEVYLSQILLGPDGTIQAVHRKFFNEGSRLFQLGQVPATLVEVKGIRTALLICSDVKHPAVSGALGREKPELILAGIASPQDPDFVMSGIIARLFDTWIVSANRVGPEDRQAFDGAMVVGDPRGRLRAKGRGREQYLAFDVGIDRKRSWLGRWCLAYYNRTSLFFFALWNARTLRSMGG